MQEAVNGAVLLQQSELASPVKLIRSGEECPAQVNDLGEHSSPEGCAATVMASQACISKIFQWSRYTEWGCRCCADGEPKPHKDWSLFRALEASRFSKSRLQKGHLYTVPYIREDF